MATKKKIDYEFLKPEDAPESLDMHPFYGLDTSDKEQTIFRDAIWSKDKRVIFVDACAGSGKTLIAAAVANMLVAYKRYSHIYYSVTSSSDMQGYLPGTIEAKSEPYFSPFYQALIKLGIDPNKVDNSIENLKSGTSFITCMTDTYFRGITFDDCVVIFDECQNMTTSQLRTNLTRCTDNCKVICLGSHLQIDLENPNNSGFIKCIDHFREKDWATVCTLTKNYRGELSAWADTLRD